MENIHIAKLKAGLLDAVDQQFAIKLRTVMRGDVHHDDRLFALFRLRRGGRLLRFSGWRFRGRLRLRRGRLLNRRRLLSNRLWDWCRLLSYRLLRSWLHRLLILRRYRLRLMDRLRWMYRLSRGNMMRRLGLRLRSNRLLRARHVRRRLMNRLVLTHRLLHLTLVRRLILVLRRLTRCFLLPICAVRGVINPVNANFTYAFNIVIKVIAFRCFIVARLHTFQWAIAEHRGTLFTAGPETMYQ